MRLMQLLHANSLGSIFFTKFILRSLVWGSKQVLKVKTLERRQTIFLSYYCPNLRKFEAIGGVTDDGLDPISKVSVFHVLNF